MRAKASKQPSFKSTHPHRKVAIRSRPEQLTVHVVVQDGVYNVTHCPAGVMVVIEYRDCNVANHGSRLTVYGSTKED